MKKLIEALQILSKYTNSEYPTYCAYEEFQVLVKPSEVSEEDKKKLEELSFGASEEDEYFYSFKYGG